MESLIESLLRISRVGREELSVQEVDLNELLAGVIDLLTPRFEQTGTTVAVPAPLPTLRCDPVRVGEVFNNLLTNAMRYNDRPAKHVEIGVAPADHPPYHRPVDTADFLVLYVKDDGIGIDSRHHDDIFRIFKRLHSQEKYGGGTGAGLAVVKKMLGQHGGDVWVESEPGQGATFYFTISKLL